MAIKKRSTNEGLFDKPMRIAKLKALIAGAEERIRLKDWSEAERQMDRAKIDKWQRELDGLELGVS